jgi:1-acyl-sn-glycerol-3-phosphate acyltransferase
MSSATTAIRSKSLEPVRSRGSRASVGRATAFLTRALVWFVFRPIVVGREHLPLGGCVVSANHLSGFDAAALTYALRPRHVRYMGKNGLFRRPLTRLAVRALGVFPARAEGPLRGGVELASELAEGGAAVAIFPEGARRRGVVRRPRHGAARVALASGVPLVPVALAGMDGWRRMAPWHVVVGEPVDLDDLRGQWDEASVRVATARLWQAILELEEGIS